MMHRFLNRVLCWFLAVAFLGVDGKRLDLFRFQRAGEFEPFLAALRDKAQSDSLKRSDTASFGRQISVASPPPPPSGYTSVPGALFDFVFPLQDQWSRFVLVATARLICKLLLTRLDGEMAP